MLFKKFNLDENLGLLTIILLFFKLKKKFVTTVKNVD